MPVFVSSSVIDNSSDANFREWTSLIHDGMLAVGIVTESVAGEMDFATVSAPAGTNEKTGFRLYRFNDSLQSTTPVFFKFIYGSGAVVNRPALWFQIGFAHQEDSFAVTGSLGDLFVTGTLGGAFTGETQSGPIVTTATPHSWSFSGDANYLTMVGWYDNSNSAFLLSLERTKDSIGDDDARGALATFFGRSPLIPTSKVLYIQSGSSVSRDTKIMTVHGSRTTTKHSGSLGEFIEVSPIVYVDTFGAEAAQNLLTYRSGDFSSGEDVFVTIDEEMHVYRLYGVNVGSFGDYFSNNQIQYWGVRFEK